MAAKVRAAGGEIYAVSSEPQTLASRATAEWHLDFESVGDPHQEIAATCRERGWLDLYVNPELDFLQRSAKEGDGFVPTHPKGYFQPGVLALTSEGRALYRWRSIPGRSNIGGAIRRPTPGHVWKNIEATLAAASGDAALDTDPEFDAPAIPWPLFASLLVANGWFVRPKAFRKPKVMIPRAFARLIGFVALWIAAFTWLPTLPVILALSAWVAFIAPRVKWVNNEFQSVKSPDDDAGLKAPVSH